MPARERRAGRVRRPRRCHRFHGNRLLRTFANAARRFRQLADVRRQLDEYVAKVRQAHKRFSEPDHPARGWKWIICPVYEDWIRGLAARHPWIISLARCITFPMTGRLTIRRNCPSGIIATADEVWPCLFRPVDDGRGNRLFEIIGHVDLPKKFGHRPPQDCTALTKNFLECGKET